MTEKTFTFTVEQIKAIFDAGRQRGSVEEASYQCGSRVTGFQYDDLVEWFHGVINEGKAFEDWTEWGEIESWIREGVQ